MKKKLFLFICIMAILVCAFALSVSAAEPDATNETVTLDDGTVCPLWDTDGNPLIWYVTGTTDGVKSYDYVVATSEAVDYNGGYSSKTDGVTWYQLSKLTINVDGASYGASSVAVFNIKSPDVKITSGQNVGQHINCITKLFTSSTNLEYVYFPLDTIDINGENFKSCKSLKFVNVAELTELREISSQDFNTGECKNLFAGQVLDLSNTKIKKLEQGALACVAATEIILPETLVDVGQWAFQSCKNATKITFLGDITSMNTNAIFNGCNSLVDIVGFKLSANATSIGSNAFKECYALKNAGDLIVDGILTLPEGIKEIGTFAFTQCDAIEAIIFPSTITKVGQQGFSYMDKVKVVNFDAHNAKVASGEKTSGVEFNNCGHFRGLVSLVAFTFPLNTVEASNRMLADCTNLTAVYMPNSIKYLASNGGGQGPFCNSTKMYFVQDIFTVGQCIVDGTVDVSKLTLPEKPTVYYMPTDLEKFTGHNYSNDQWSNATIFKNCTSINDVLVFGENFTKMVTMRPFENMASADSPKTLVFMGDIEEFVISHQARYISFVFVNANDKQISDLGVVRVTGNSNEKGSLMYFCSTGTKINLDNSSRVGSGTNPETDAEKIATTISVLETTATVTPHIAVNSALTNTSDPDCVTNSIVTTYCFCGTKIADTEIENTALGHEYDTEKGATKLSIAYENYIDNGVLKIECARCDICLDTEIAPIITSFKGISVKINGDGVTFGYTINYESVEEFETVNKTKLELGFVVAVKSLLDGENPLDANGNETTDKVIKVAVNTDYNYAGADFVLRGDWNRTVSINGTETDIKDVEFYMSGYVIHGETIKYINFTSTADAPVSVTYNQVNQ